MPSSTSADPRIAPLQAQAEALARSGQGHAAGDLWQRILLLAPRHATALNQLGALALANGDLAQARDYLQRAIAAEPKLAMAHANLSRLHAHCGENDAALAAISAAIAADPTAWGPHFEKAQLLESLQRIREAAIHWSQGYQYLPDALKQSPQLQPLLQRATAAIQANQGELGSFLDARLHALLAGRGERELERIQHSLDILSGRRSFVTAKPLTLPIPRLPAIPFFRREDFSWAAELESAFPEILAELHAVLADGGVDGGGFQPYVQTPAGQPMAQFAPLDRSLDWGAYFLWNHGRRIDAHAERCPRTEAALLRIPQMQVPQRAPVAFFSALKPGTHIPPHNGATNARLTVHLPLIVPPDCALRVGGETRLWHPGELLLFDDTIRHEAWNYSDRLRVVLIFDVWHPMLSALERDMVVQTTQALMAYYGDHADLGEL